MQIAVLGRQPEISLAELEVLFGAKNITKLSDQIAQVGIDTPLPQARLGGTMKSAKLLVKAENTDLAGAFSYIKQAIPEYLEDLPEGKLQFGVSVYGFDVHTSWLLKQMLTLKKMIKKSGRSVRIIENKKPELESAQVLYNKLTSPLGWEFLIIKHGNDVILAKTTGVQNIDDYSKRDFDRPKRDAYVGMLPPKLAQIMLNLAVQQSQEAHIHDSSLVTQSSHDIVVLDPFCGTGVVLQEAMLMGFAVYGSDISQKMVEYSRDNLNWIQDFKKIRADWRLKTADATKYTWTKPFDVVVCETYLGKPLTSLPQPSDLDKIIDEANTIATDFLKNISAQLKKGTRLCLALPAWNMGNNNFSHLRVLDQLTDLGYNRLDLKHASKQDLIYHREDQIVARELTILEKV